MKPPKRIRIESYDPNWHKQFQALSQELARHLPDFVQSIAHVGSTAVPGLAAKPILDMDIIIQKDADHLQAVIEALTKIGYKHRGDLGIPGREAFKRLSEQVPHSQPARTWPVHHLYVCMQGCQALQNHLALRDFLRKNPDARDAYGELKKKLAQQFTYDIDRYIEGKSAFISEILQKSGISVADRKEIEQQNKAP